MKIRAELDDQLGKASRNDCSCRKVLGRTLIASVALVCIWGYETGRVDLAQLHKNHTIFVVRSESEWMLFWSRNPGVKTRP
jgi:hypothetical protein